MFTLDQLKKMFAPDQLKKMFAPDQLKKNNIILLIAVAVLIIFGLWLYFTLGSKRNGLTTSRGVAVEAEEVRQGSITRRISAAGTLSANQSVIIRPQIRGVIKKINFHEGFLVQPGDSLVEIDDRPYKAALKEAQAHLTNAKAQYARVTKLAALNAVPLKKRDEAQSELESSEARFDKAQFELENTIITAPFEGIVGLKDFSVGASVDERTDLVTLIDIDPIKVDFRVPGQFLQYLSHDQQITTTIDGFGAETFTGTIDAIDAKVDPLAHSIAVKAILPNPKGILKPGLYAHVSLVVGSKDKTLIIPETALLSSGDEQYVYRVIEGTFSGIKQSVAVKTIVTKGLSESGNVEILRGLLAGEKVVTVGQSKIRDGTPVRIVYDIENPDIGSSTQAPSEPKEKPTSSSEKLEATQESKPKAPLDAVKPKEQ